MNIKINHRLGVKNVDRFNNFDFTLKYDSVGSVFGLGIYFNPNSQKDAEMLCVSHFHEVIVEHNKQKLLTGYILSQKFNKKAQKQLANVGGYSKPGVLEDCNIPPEIYPIQMNGLTLAQIAKRVCAPFKIKVIIDPAVSSEMNKAISKVTCEPTTSVKDFLTEHATQRNVIITHDADGNLVFTKAKTDIKPIMTIDDDNPQPGVEVELEFQGQEIHSQITVMKQADDGNAGEYTIKNPLCPIVFRPKTIIQSSGDDISVKETAENALAAELKNIPLTVSISRWDKNSKLIFPNNIISVKSRENFLYKYTDFFIESVRYTGDEKETTAVLTCVLPFVYNRKTPVNPFVDVHKNFPRV